MLYSFFLSKKYHTLLLEKLVWFHSKQYHTRRVDKVNRTIVCQLMPSLSLVDDYQTFAFHNSIIVQPNIFGETKVVQYFSARFIIHFSRELEELIEYYTTTNCQLKPSLLLYEDYQSFLFHNSIIVLRTIVGTAIVEHYFSARSISNFSQENLLTSQNQRISNRHTR